MPDKTGKGVLYLTIANAVFFIAGFAISIGLARLLQVEQFGLYGVVISTVSLANIIFVNGFKQSVSKFVAEEGGLSPRAEKTVFLSVLAVGLALFLAIFFGAGLIAMLLNDPALAFFIQIVSVLVITYSLHAFFIGYINGLRKFRWEAIVRAVSASLKAALVLGLAAFTLSVRWAFAGFVLASAVKCSFGFIAFKAASAKRAVKERAGSCSFGKFFRFAMPLLAFVLITNFILSIDLLMVKALSLQTTANAMTAYYTAASTVSKLPLHAVLALVAVLLPVISHWSYRERIDKVQFYIRNANRYTIMLLALVTVLISATAAQLVQFLFGARYLPAAEPLSILIFGLGFFALFLVLSSIVSGHGKPAVVTVIAVAALVLDFALNLVLIPAYGIVGAALASTAAMLAALVILSAYIVLSFKAFCRAKSLVRIFLAAAIAYAVAFLLPFSGWMLLFTYCAASLAYAVVLLASRELKKADMVVLNEVVF